ncbi:hypothetical protein [uncultured Lacinutrix sp.]|uniref:hypothetical protein n=1 Tax=uncultured Lacinutrix sp. TaxID=574032 RepID=UPI002626B7C5|nr:hypothetical protein [uncultured Lacinutrix sp.]
MNRITIIFFILFLNLSCSEKNKDDKLLKENSLLKTKISELEKDNAALSKQNDILQSLKPEKKETEVTELRFSKVIKTLDERFSKDTLDLKKYGNEYVFERNVELTKLDNKLFAETFGNIREQLNSFGYSIFSICDGESLPLEMCNCTDSIYVVIEPEELGEDYELYRIGFFYNVDLISLERIEKDNNDYDFELTFEHGEYPRKKEKINLTRMNLEK